MQKVQFIAALSVLTLFVTGAWLASSVILQAETDAHLQVQAARGALGATAAVSCKQGSQILRREGFQNIKAFDCTGPGYRYFARKKNQQRVVLMNAQNAAYLVVD